MSASQHDLLLNETVYKTLSHIDKKRRLYLYEWLTYLDKNLPHASRKQIKDIQKTLIAQLIHLFNAFPGPPIRHLIAKNMSVLFSIGDVVDLYSTVEKCNDFLKSKEHETQMQQLAKLCALNVIGALYEKLGRMMNTHDETVHVLFRYMKSADSQVRIEIVQTFEKILYGLGQQQSNQSLHKEIYKQLKPLCQDRVLAVRCASIKCLCEMIKHSVFLYSSPSSAALVSSSVASSTGSNTSSAAASATLILNASSTVSHELESNIQLGFKALDNSNYDVRCNVSVYLAQLIFYSISQLQQQQLQLQQQQQMANASIMATASLGNNNLSGGGIDGNSKQQKEQAAQQQANAQAQAIMNERIKNTLLLLANGFNKLNSSNSVTGGKFNLVKGAASSLAASANSVVTSNTSSTSNTSNGSSVDSISNSNNLNENAKRNSSGIGLEKATSSQVINREIRIGVTYAYVELANLLGSYWLERNLKLYINHVLNLVNGTTKAVSTHLDAVYSRKCVQFILRSIIGGMLNEKVQLQAARELIHVIEKCCQTNATSNGNELSNQQHVLICAIYELSCILKCLNTSASILITDDRDSASLRMVDKLLAALLYPNNGVKCVSAWCLRTLACSLPALMSPLLDTCMDRLHDRNPSDALVGYGYACASLLGSVNACPLGIPHLKPKIAFNLGEELLRTAKQSNNITLAMQKTSIGWLLLGSFMTLGPTVVRKHIPRLKKLWNSTMPSSVQELESEKKRGDLATWQMSLESRTGALSSIHSFLLNCSDLISNSTNIEQSAGTTLVNQLTIISSENLLNSILTSIEGGILLLSQLHNIIRMNNVSTNSLNSSGNSNSNSATLYRLAATFRLKLYQTLLALPSPHLYESSFAIILRELVADFTQADQQLTLVTTSTLRSVCHSNDSILFANCWLQDADFKVIEDQLQPHSASGCEALEHDITFLYQKTCTSSMPATNIDNSTAILNITTIKPLTNATFFSSLSSLYVTNSTAPTCQAALPLGVAVIDASIQLYGIMYPKVPNKHRAQILAHFIECIQRQSTAKSNATSKQALQINIFTAVLGSLKSLAEMRSDLGDESVRKNTLKLVMDTLCHSNPILRCAAGEALGRMTQVVGESHFVIELAQICFEKLKNSQDVTSRTGYALGLGCLHRYVGNMGAGQDMTSSVSILFAMAQNSASSIVQVWAIHALYLIIDSGGSMFRNYIEPCIEFIVHSILSIPHTNRDVYVGLGKLLSSLITFMGPELQISSPSNNDMRAACMTTCTVMQTHNDSMIRCEAIQCLQEMHLFASAYVNLKILVPYLVSSLVSKDFLVRKVAVSCLRQLCQKDSIEVCDIARKFIEETKPMGLLCLINERGLECLIFKMIDIETNPFLIRDLHDILNSILSSSLNEVTLKNWLSLCKDIAISSDEILSDNNNTNSSANFSNINNNQLTKRSKTLNDEEENANENEDDYDDSESFNASNIDTNVNKMMGNLGSSSFSSKSGNDQLNSNLKLKQITKLISPKWPNRVFAIELIRKIISICVGNSVNTHSNSVNQNGKDASSLSLKRQAHFDLALAKKLQTSQNKSSETYLILFLQDLMRIACMGATSSCDPLKLVGLDLLHDLILFFSKVEEPNPEFKGHLILEQYQAQVSAALRPQFSIETSAHVTAKACQVCSMWISSGVARDLNDLRRVHQLLVSSLQKLTNNSLISSNTISTATLSEQILTTIGGTLANNLTNSNTSEQQLIYSELSLTVEKLAVLRAWADVYIVAQMKTLEKTKYTNSKSSAPLNNRSESLLSLVQPELSLLSYHWSVALKDYAFLCLPSDYANQLPIEGGAFYHADLVESSRPIYKEHFTKILLAYSIWLNEIKFEIKELPANQNPFQSVPTTTSIPDVETSDDSDLSKKLVDQKEKLFFMLLGLSLETLSNKTGLAQLADETIENILESIENLLRTNLAHNLLLKKSNGTCICIEILSILYKVKLTRDLMSINLMVLKIVEQINEIRLTSKENSATIVVDQETTSNNIQTDDVKAKNNQKRTEKNISALIFVILEICMRDLIKYSPNLFNSSDRIKVEASVIKSDQPLSSNKTNNAEITVNKASFLYMHVNTCKEISKKDSELLINVINVLNYIPFYPDVRLEKRISLISIVYHILFNLIESVNSLTIEKANNQVESSLYAAIFDSLKQMCSTSTHISKWYFQFSESKSSSNQIENENENEPSQSLIKAQQSALMSILLLKNVKKEIIMRMLSLFFQYSSMKVFEPLNVYEKCKVFMCSMRCSDNLNELFCLIQSLNDILQNNQTKKELRIILLKEHLSYLLKITSATAYMPLSLCKDSTNNEPQTGNFLAIINGENLQVIKSIIDLLESMVNILNDDESLKEHETLTIFIHILSMYLNDPNVEHSDNKTRLLNDELNDLVLKKLLNLGVKYKQEFKQVLEKWPNLKAKIGAAFKSMNAQTNQTVSSSSNQSNVGQQQNQQQIQPNRPPKIQLNFNFSKFK